DLEHAVSVLAATAGLADEAAFAARRAADGLAVGDLRPAGVRLDFVLALHAVDDDLEVELAHPGDDRLPGLLVEADAERRVFLAELLERLGHLRLVVARLRLDRNRDHRLRERDRLKEHGVVAIA